MIAQINGTLAHKSVSHIVVNNGGIGFRVFVPLTTFYELPEVGDDLQLYIHTHVKEDAINLFGFHTAEERDIFQLMISVNGIGPKLALNILSGISAAELVSAVGEGNLGRLTSIPGVGRKIAERVVLELRDKVAKLIPEEASGISVPQLSADEILAGDALSALTNLGYKSKVAKEAIDKVIKQAEGPLPLDSLLKQSLNILSN
ncbi:MAG: Holliday junction branch migration protein RuvA [Smithellaceae bacterium]|nr:Holliday junction branch migration protein RuvA [Smithellaceae bacterium]